MIQGCQDDEQSTRTDVSFAEDNGSYGKSSMSLFLTESDPASESTLTHALGSHH